jgi:adenylylsulfate kinase-like enzyme
MNPAFAVWLTGLSGSGKSTVAKALLGLLHERGVHAAVLESDVMRTQLTPFPRYDEAERDYFYGALAKLAQSLAEDGVPAIIDATANLRRYRDAARACIPRFAEIFVDTPLAVCEARDPKGLYRAARAGSAVTLPGVQAVYEPPLRPELTVSGESQPRKAAAAILKLLQGRGWVSG